MCNWSEMCPNSLALCIGAQGQFLFLLFAHPNEGLNTWSNSSEESTCV